MRFLVIAKNKHPIPPEMVPGIMDAMTQWVKTNTSSRKIEQAWGYAGQPSGGGILSVSSPEELDIVMSTCPVLPFSDVEYYPLVDLPEALQRAKQAAQQMMAPMGGGNGGRR